ncbi:hypothetical protein G6F23_014187 [Rhizopus arrhizus]|nr:hypothetical protein G6F23_014187 [Rhizopus arrhizus]
MVQVQPTTGRIMAITLLGDGDADDARVRMRDARQHRLRIFRRDQGFQQAADDRDLLARLARCIGAAQGQGVQPVLRRQRVARIGLAQRDAANAPAAIRAGMQRRFVDRRQMRARERAQPQVHDAHAPGGPVIAGARHRVRQRGQARGRQARRAGGYQFHSVPSCWKRFTGR